MNKLENKLIRNISCFKRYIPAKESYEAIRMFYKEKSIPSFNLGLTFSKMISCLLLNDVLQIDRLNSCTTMIKDEEHELFLKKYEMYKLMSFEMINSIAFGPIKEHVYLKRASQKFNEAAIKKALNIKGWYQFSIENKRRKEECVVISHANEGFIFGNNKTEYFIWDFDSNDFKTRK
jgi:hypothetical protein